MAERLLDVERTTNRWTGTRAIVLLDRSLCLQCRTSDVERLTIDEPQMFRSHGHGATRRTNMTFCGNCGDAFVEDVTEVNPNG